jgi:hypothetical protein
MAQHTESSAVAEAKRLFEDAGLLLPPVPSGLRAKFRRLDEWLYGSRAVIPLAMYLFEPYLLEAIHSKVPDYVAIGHLGHGINSYAITYQLVYGSIACFTQTAWGGVYGDPDSETAEARRQLEKCAQLVELAERSTGLDRRLIVVENPYNEVGICEWLPSPLGARAAKTWLDDHRNSCSDPLTSGIRRLSGGGPSGRT